MDIEQIISYFKSNSRTPFLLIQPIQTELPTPAKDIPPFILAGHNTGFTTTDAVQGHSWHLDTETTPLLKVRFHYQDNIYLPHFEIERQSSHLILQKFPPELCIGAANIRGYSSNQFGRYHKLAAPVINQFLHL